MVKKKRRYYVMTDIDVLQEGGGDSTILAGPYNTKLKVIEKRNKLIKSFKKDNPSIVRSELSRGIWVYKY